MRMRVIFYREFFEGNSRKFSKFESENEGNIYESFGNPNLNSFTSVSKVQEASSILRMGFAMSK